MSVPAEQRREGVGSALLAAATEFAGGRGRTTFHCETYVPSGAATSPGLAFAVARGFDSATAEDHLVLDLSAGAAVQEGESGIADGYEVVSWRGRCPDALIGAYCDMRNRMNTDVPTGETDIAPVAITPERIRTGEGAPGPFVRPDRRC